MYVCIDKKVARSVDDVQDDRYSDHKIHVRVRQ